MNMIEKVARAIFAVVNPLAAGSDMTDYDSAWANERGQYMGIVTPSLTDQARESARAALEVMRNMDFVTRNPFEETFIDAFRAMIDAALNEKG